MQVQPVVPSRPRRADVDALEHDNMLPLPLQHRSASQSRRPRSNYHDHNRVLHEGAKDEQDAERFVRTVRSECLDWLPILNRRPLERVLRVYVEH